MNSEAYQQDGDYIKDIEINDLRNRYTLTKGPVQKRVNKNFCCPLISRIRPAFSLSALVLHNYAGWVEFGSLSAHLSVLRVELT